MKILTDTGSCKATLIKLINWFKSWNCTKYEQGRYSLKDNVLRTIAENPEAFEISSEFSSGFCKFFCRNKLTNSRIYFIVEDTKNLSTSFGFDISVLGWYPEYSYEVYQRYISPMEDIEGYTSSSTRKLLWNRVVYPAILHRDNEAIQQHNEDIENKLRKFTTIQVIEKVTKE